MRLKWKLTVASVKMFVRQKEAILWSILLPLFMVFLFSFVNFDGLGTVTVGVVNLSRDSSLVGILRSVKTLRLHEGTLEAEMKSLREGDRSMILLIPEMYEPGVRDSVATFLNAERAQETQLGTLIVRRALDDLAFRRHGEFLPPTVQTEIVNSRNLTYIDFVLPGILSMSIMQSGVFGVAFSFVNLKKRGILRRLLVTPINPNDFIFAQVLTRLMVLMMQVAIMVGAGLLVFDLHFVGSIANMFIVGLLGGVVFLAIGFTLSGLAKSDDQVAPLANVITLPMMLLSGIFFSRATLPGFANVITGFFPLTYLADGMRSIAIDGASLAEIMPQLVGLAVWGVITVTLAVKSFRWESEA